MGSESVASCAASPEPGIAFREEALDSRNTPDRGLHQRGSCFHCKQEGHWVKDCPSRPTPGPPPRPAPAAVGVGGYPELQCRCGRACVVFTSRTKKNPGRDFYSCPAMPISEKCKFFKWCDEVKPERHFRPVKLEQRYGTDKPPYPTCSCHAGTCSLLTMRDGENAGRKYFACPIKKGQGACNFFQWHDTVSNSKPPEKNKDTGEDDVPSFFQWYDTASKPPEKNNDIGDVDAPSFHLVPEEPKTHKMEDGGAGEAKDGSQSEEMSSDVSIVPAVPSTSSREHQANHAGGEFSPLKRLHLHAVSPTAVASKLGKCSKCGKEGHWMKECVISTSPCFKCGKFGHRKKDCIA